MTSIPILSQLWSARSPWRARIRPQLRAKQAFYPRTQDPSHLPRFVRESAVAMRYLRFLGSIDWPHFPERDLLQYRFCPPVPYAPFAAACLVKIQETMPYMSRLRTYLVEHPALTWLLGFPLVPSRQTPWGFDPEASLPTPRHFTRMLRTMPNSGLQWLLDETVRLLQLEFATVTDTFGQAISLDTKHILAWVKENNPKAYVSDRYAKDKQPQGDPDCRVGCKRRRNQRSAGEAPASPDDVPPTPRSNPRSPKGLRVGEFHWGYASGVVATKVPDWAEVVLAELTQPFDQPDVSYFFPLLADTERRLGFRPCYGAFDAGFDAWYVYAHFHHDGQDWSQAFAAVPFVQRGSRRQFDAEGRPLCKAGLPMVYKQTFFSRTAYVPHEKTRYTCPLHYPEPVADACPIGDKHWDKGGCVTTMPSSVGARVRHQIDRESSLYKEIYKQRTATERINSQAKEWGIESPRLRNAQAIRNQNTLIYVLINLRALERIRKKKAELEI